jgi:membrane-associated phospholipid phosphatase
MRSTSTAPLTSTARQVAGRPAARMLARAGPAARSRMYRGEHHPTDILGSLIFAALWLTATSALIKPNAAARAPARPKAGEARPAGWRPTAAAPADRR